MERVSRRYRLHFWGFENFGVVPDMVTMAKRVVERARHLGLLVGKSGCFWNTIRFAPPMCITRPDIDFLADCLDRCLTEAAGGAN